MVRTCTRRRRSAVIMAALNDYLEFFTLYTDSIRSSYNHHRTITSMFSCIALVTAVIMSSLSHSYYTKLVSSSTYYDYITERGMGMMAGMHRYTKLLQESNSSQSSLWVCIQ
jgi:hypothetical protein